MARTRITTQWDPVSVDRTFAALRSFNPLLVKTLRRRWWDATRPMVAAMRRDLGEGPKAAAIGSAIRVSTVDSVLGNGIVVELVQDRLDASQQVLARKWDDRKPFRHPVFGVWRPNVPSQAKRPWFAHNVKTYKPRIEAATALAVAETTAAINRGGL